MTWLNWVSIILMIGGLALFLYGANFYVAAVGWTGFYLGIAGVLLCVATFVYAQLNKKEPEQTVA